MTWNIKSRMLIFYDINHRRYEFLYHSIQNRRHTFHSRRCLIGRKQKQDHKRNYWCEVTRKVTMVHRTILNSKEWIRSFIIFRVWRRRMRDKKIGRWLFRLPRIRNNEFFDLYLTTFTSLIAHIFRLKRMRFDSIRLQQKVTCNKGNKFIRKCREHITAAQFPAFTGATHYQ